MYVIYKLQSYVFWRVKQNKSPCFCLKAAGIAPFLPRGCVRACKPLIFNALQTELRMNPKDRLLLSKRPPFANVLVFSMFAMLCQRCCMFLFCDL